MLENKNVFAKLASPNKLKGRFHWNQLQNFFNITRQVRHWMDSIIIWLLKIDLEEYPWSWTNMIKQIPKEHENF